MPRDLTCFNYFCRACWELQHGSGLPHHRPIMRNIRGGGNIDRGWVHISSLSLMSANGSHYYIILGLSSLYLAWFLLQSTDSSANFLYTEKSLPLVNSPNVVQYLYIYWDCFNIHIMDRISTIYI